MSLDEADDVPEARSFCSIKTTRSPRPAASRAMPVPLMPPPMTARSKSATDSPLFPDYQLFRRAPEAPCLNFWIGDDPVFMETPQMDFRDRHIVVTGGAGALGTAVVTALIEAGAICHVPCFDEAEAKRFRLRDHKQVVVT